MLGARLLADILDALCTHPIELARFTSADGGAAEAEIPAGALWRPSETHAVDNIGTTDIWAIAVELK
jgi:hypothetical protein